MSTSTQNDRIREAVSKNYSEAVSRPAAGSCCGASATQKGAAARVAGYTSDELATLPEDAVVNSFGCGNPLAFSGVREGDTVVDLGSGAGIDLLIAAKKVGPAGHVIGVDMTDDMIARARENIAKAGVDNVEVRKGLIEELPIESDSVDWVISNCVINLSPDKPRVFREIARVLKPGGHMLVSDMVVERLPGWMRRSMRLYSACVAGAIGEKAYLEGLRQAGLENVEIKGRTTYEPSQIAALIESEVSCGDSCPVCRTAGKSVKLVMGPVSRYFAKRIQSLQISAQKAEVPAALVK